MQNPAPELSQVRKYSCCPEKFGYHFVQMNGNQDGRENIHLTDFEETKACSDDERVVIRSCLFKRLMVELSSMANVRAQESLKILINRLQTGEIAINAENAYLSHKDICHRFFSHLRGCKQGTFASIVLHGWLIQPFFLNVDDKPSCIHQFRSIMYQYPAEQKEKLFGSVVEQEYMPLKPLLSLKALAAQAIAAKDKQNARESVPGELKHLLH